MIVALWHRWLGDRRLRWLLLVGAVLVVDATVGAWLVAWEIRLIREALS